METDSKNAPFDDPRRSAPRRPRISYVPREDATPEGELSTLAAVYSVILKSHERKMTADARHGEGITEVGDAEESPHESPTKDGGG